MFNTCLEAEREFEKCWKNPRYTSIELNDVDINQVLMYYILQKPLKFTKTMLWDMETKKAWNPGAYIPYVVREGSARAWGKHPCPETRGEIFVRSSAQRQWLSPETYEDVYEEVYVNPRKQLITFLGVTDLPDGPSILKPTQALFHVQHGASGTEDQPKNTWRIVHLTEGKNLALVKSFERMNDKKVLPGFVESYIKNDLKVALRK
jgi:hypothetical protein